MGRHKKTEEKALTPKFSTLYIDPEALRRIMYYTQAADGEVSGLGTIQIRDDKKIIVDKIFLLEQEAGAADTEIDGDAIAKLMTDMIQKGEDSGRLKFWWHSHVNMSTFWSGTDDDCAETLGREYSFSLVVNKQGDKRCRLDLYNPFRLTIDNIRVEELLEEDSELKKECEEEVKTKVRERIYSYSGYGYNSGRYNKGSWDKDWDNEDYWKNKGGHNSERSSESEIDVKQEIADDIDRLLTIAQAEAAFADNEWALSQEIWQEYIWETLKEIAKKRFDKKIECQSGGFGEWTNEAFMCKRCKVKKVCQYWTQEFDKIDPGAGIEFIDVV